MMYSNNTQLDNSAIAHVPTCATCATWPPAWLAAEVTIAESTDTTSTAVSTSTSVPESLATAHEALRSASDRSVERLLTPPASSLDERSVAQQNSHTEPAADQADAPRAVNCLVAAVQPATALGASNSPTVFTDPGNRRWPPTWLKDFNTIIASGPACQQIPSLPTLDSGPISGRDPESDQADASDLPGGVAVEPLPSESGATSSFDKLKVCEPGEFQFWDGQQLHSDRDVPLAIDVETALIADERVVPRLAIATATDGVQRFVIHPDRLGEFLDRHRQEFFVGHNIQFDFWVINEHLSQSGHAAQRVLWDACHDGRLRDTMILDMVVQLGTGKYRKVLANGNREDTRIYPGNLADVVADYTTLLINKDDPYRLRFGELIGLSPDALRTADPAFFQYAVRDVVATHLLYPALAGVAYQLMIQHGFRETASRFEIRPDAIEKFGLLSETIQVKASIVLSHMFRTGVHVDQAHAREMTKRHRQRITELTGELQHHFPDVLTYDRSGGIKTTPKGKTPSLGRDKLAAMLQRVADEIRELGQIIDIPLSEGKLAGISQSVKAWQKYVNVHPFLKLWAEIKQSEKLLGFLTKLDSPVLHCQYGLLTRTGRTACSQPHNSAIPGVNLQQIPRLPEFRGLFVPRDPDHQLFIADYSAVELRTLGATCRAKYGNSKLADVIEQGVDPHAFTAAAIQNMPFDEFLTLKLSDPDRFRHGRQAAKAINFGVPGGLGAKALRAYAESNYHVSLTEGEAAAFRSKLITEVFPELNDQDGYLADNSMAALARTLGVSEPRVWETFDHSGKRNPLAARGVANVIRGRSTASPYYQRNVWMGLQRLICSAKNVGKELSAAIHTATGSPTLYDRLYRQKVATLTGRIRDGVGFTESKNTPFQSLAADGAKLALWNLLYAGWDVYGFIHDEIIVDLPPNSGQQAAQQIKGIMERSMEVVLGGIPAACEWTIGNRWGKPD